MKLLIVLLILSLVGYITTAYKFSSYTLSSKEDAYKCMDNMGLNHFLENTNIHQTLGGERRNVLGVINAVNFAFYDYAETLGNNNPAIIATKLFSEDICECFLQDNQAALEELRHVFGN